MMKQKTIITLALLAICLLCIVSPVSALGISLYGNNHPVVIPGQDYSSPGYSWYQYPTGYGSGCFVVSATSSETQPQVIKAEVGGMGLNPDGTWNWLYIEPALDTSPTTARPYFTLNKDTVLIAPGTTDTVCYRLNVPVGTPEGMHQAVIKFWQAPSDINGNGVGFAVALQMGFFVDVPFSEAPLPTITPDLKIKKIPPGKVRP